MKKMEIIELDINSVIPFDRNPRYNEQAVTTLAECIRQFGWTSPILLDENKVIICGHTRLKAAKQLGMKKVPCIIAKDLTPEQVMAHRIADNRLSELTAWNYELLISESEYLKEAGFDLSWLNIEMVDLDMPDEIKEGKTENDAIPEMSEAIVSVPGEIYKCGDHLLMCGDSMSEDDLYDLMGKSKANLYLTDPPYNVNIASENGKKIQNDDMSDSRFYAFLEIVFMNVIKFMDKNCIFYIYYAMAEFVNFHLAARAAGLEVKQELQWIKKHFVLGRHDYHYKSEPCMYGWLKGAQYVWYGARLASNLFKYKKPNVNKDHPTPKPVDMLIEFLKNSTKRGDIVLDSFGGSGSTMIACEQTGRKCRMMELDPKYCDVIRRRWAEFVYGEGCDWQQYTPTINKKDIDNG